jgi:hypothetical protein
MKRVLILALLLVAGSFLAAYVRRGAGSGETRSARIHNGVMESEADRILANLGS